MEQKLKVFLNGSEEVRIFPFNLQDGFAQLEQKIKSTFHIGDVLDMKMYWRDNEGDLVRVSCDEDIHTMLSEPHSQSYRKLYVQTNKQSSSQAAPPPQTVEHAHVSCDGCNAQPIRGTRYKCLQCSNYDLCDTCFNNKVHPQHSMIVLRQNELPWSPSLHAIQNLVNPTLARKAFMESWWRCHPDALPQPSSTEVPPETTSKQEQEQTPNQPEAPSVSTPPVSGSTVAETGPPVSSETPTTGTTQSTGTPPTTPTAYIPGSGWGASSGGIFPNLFRGWYPLQPSVPTQGAMSHATEESSRLPPHIRNALGHMLNMGYVDENGCLTQMLIRHNGDICKCLDEIQRQQATPHGPPHTA